MPVSVHYPKVSLEMSSGKISRWLVAEGAGVAKGDVLFEIENDKAAVEVEAPSAGVLRGLTPAGQEVAVGDPVARIVAPGEVDQPEVPVVQDAIEAAAEPAHAQPAVAPKAAPGGLDRGPNPTPLARRIARAHGINLLGVAGTGPRGRVQRCDVMAELSRLAAAPTQSQPIAATGGLALSIEGNRLHGTWLRRSDGLPVVLLHGFSADLNNWRGMLAAARPDWPAYAVDLPCHGQSTRTLPKDLDAIAELVEAHLHEAGISECVMAGHSFGGAVAARIGSRGMIDLRGLCLFAPAGLHPGINEAFASGILRATRPETLRPWLHELVQDSAVITPVFESATAKAREDVGLTEAMKSFADRFFADGTQSFSIRRDLAGLSRPVRVISGREDQILPYPSARALPDQVGLHLLANCGHMPHLERPVLSMRLLSELWRSAL